MLADDEIVVRVGRDRVFLRPSLRAAMRLDRLGGFEKLVRAIANENVTTMASIIREGEERRSDLPDLLESLGDLPIAASVEAMKEPLLRFVCQLYGFDGSAPESADQENAEPVSFSEHYARLYRVATGWLGWPPAEAWDATPSEIMEAGKGRTELLKAIFGGSDKPADDGGEQAPEVFNAKLSAAFAMASARFAGQGAA